MDTSDLAARARSLGALFEARSVAVVGASEDPTRIGGRPLRYTLDSGFAGPVYPVNPKYAEIAGRRCYPDLDALPEPPDACVLAVGAAQVPDALRRAAAAGARSAVVFASGYAEVGPEGRAAQEELAAIAREGGVHLLGPNCLGAINFVSGLAASFTTVLEAGTMAPGPVGFACQSGAFGSYFLALARKRGLGVSTWAATGNEADVTVADCIAHLAGRDDTEVVAAYTEGVRDGPAFGEALALAHAAGKPVLVLKAGRSEAGARAAVSHTGSMAGDDEVFSAVCERHGAYRVRDLAELLDVAEAHAARQRPKGSRVCLLTVSGGVGIMMADRAAEVGAELPPLPEAARATLRARVPFAGLANPVDFTGQAINEPDLMEVFLDEVVATGEYDAVVTFLGHILESPSVGPRAVDAFLAAVGRTDLPLFLSGSTLPGLERRLRDGGVPLLSSPVVAVEVARALARIGAALAAPLPEGGPAAPGRLAAFLPPGAAVLDEATSLLTLEACGVPAVRFRRAPSEDEAVAAAAEIGWPVVVKADAAGLSHKTEAGGVVLGLTDADGVRRACRGVAERVGRFRPGALRGFVVAEMATGGLEAIVGVRRDPVFGPVVAAGLGGTHAEAVSDRAVAVAPVSVDQASDLLGRTRLGRVLASPRGREGLDADALARAIAALSSAAAGEPRLLEAEANPLLVRPDGVVALDGLVVVGDPPPPPTGGKG